jgi:hypothetical protein
MSTQEAAMAATAAETRHRGRRKQADPKKADRHIKGIREAQKRRRKLESDAQKSMDTLAKRINAAMQDGVETNRIATELQLSRQMVYKLVRERVDGRPLGQTKANQNGQPGA